MYDYAIVFGGKIRAAIQADHFTTLFHYIKKRVEVNMDTGKFRDNSGGSASRGIHPPLGKFSSVRKRAPDSIISLEMQNFRIAYTTPDVGVFLVRQQLKAFSKDCVEAAQMDGAGPWRGSAAQGGIYGLTKPF